MEAREQEMNVKLQEVDDRSRSNKHRIDRLEEKMDEYLELVVAIQTIAESMKFIQKDVERVQKNVNKLDGKMEVMQKEITEAQNKPDKERADTMKSLGEKLLWLIVGGVVAFLFFQATGIKL